MENFFIAQYFDWRVRRASNVDRVLNRAMKAVRIPYRFRTAELSDGLVKRLTGWSLPAATSGISTNIEQRMNIYHLAEQTIAYGVDGDFAELGCNQGGSSVLLQKVIEGNGSSKTLHLYDSFEGLPAISSEDGNTYAAGDLATTDDIVRRNFERYGLRQPVIHKGWFADTLPTQLPDRIAFALLDGDLYDSILVSLEHVYPRLSKGAVCLIDDYCDPAVYPQGWNMLPGVKKACDDFLKDKPERVAYIYSGAFSHGFFRKL